MRFLFLIRQLITLYWGLWKDFLTRASAGLGDATPMSFFLKWPPNHLADCAEILHSLMGIHCATFGQKFWPGQVTEQWRHKGNSLHLTFQGNRVFSHGTCCHRLEWGHYARFRSAHDHMWHCKMTFQRSSEVNDIGWHHTYQSWLIWQFKGIPEVLRPNTWLFFGMDIFIVPLYTIRCQLGPLTQFALSLQAILPMGWCCSRLGYCAPQIFHQETVITLHFVQNWMGNMLVKVLCHSTYSFCNILMQSWKIADSMKI